MTKSIPVSKKLIAEARRNTFAFINDLAAPQRRLLEKARSQTPRENPNDSAPGLHLFSTHSSMVEEMANPRVDSLISFILYTNLADQMRKNGNHSDAVYFYQVVNAGLAGGALSSYVNDPKRLIEVARSKTEAVSSITPTYLYEPGSVVQPPVAWKVQLPLTSIHPYFPFTGHARSLLSMGHTALAAQEYYAALGLNNRSARAHEGVADSLIGNTDHKNTAVIAAVQASSEVKGNSSVLLIASLKYQSAFMLLQDYAVKNDLDAHLNFLTNALLHGGLSYRDELKLDRIAKAVARRDRMKAKAEEFASYLSN